MNYLGNIHNMEKLAIITLVVLLFLMMYLCTILYSKLTKERFRNRSLSTKYGKLTEQFLPLVDSYPWDPSYFRFLGSPIDGVQFEADKVIFVEFKSGTSKLSKNQRVIRDLVDQGFVEFRVVRVD
jgi:predicted Holliday junction resolvase-like endonuclease